MTKRTGISGDSERLRNSYQAMMEWFIGAAKVRVSNENGKSDVLRRSIQHLVPLEVSQDSNVDEIKRNQTGKSTVVEDSKENRGRPRRAAAIANELLRGEHLKNKLLISSVYIK